MENELKDFSQSTEIGRAWTRDIEAKYQVGVKKWVIEDDRRTPAYSSFSPSWAWVKTRPPRSLWPRNAVSALNKCLKFIFNVQRGRIFPPTTIQEFLCCSFLSLRGGFSLLKALFVLLNEIPRAAFRVSRSIYCYAMLCYVMCVLLQHEERKKVSAGQTT